MRLPRWLVVGLLASSALAVLGSVWLWWIDWPIRTAREFEARLADADFNTWEFLGGSDLYRGGFRTQLNLTDRSISDRILGRQRFWCESVAYGFVAEKGRVYWVDGVDVNWARPDQGRTETIRDPWWDERWPCQPIPWDEPEVPTEE